MLNSLSLKFCIIRYMKQTLIWANPQSIVNKYHDGPLSRYLAYLLFRVFVGVLVLIYRWAIIHVYVSIIAILLYFDDMIDIK